MAILTYIPEHRARRMAKWMFAATHVALAVIIAPSLIITLEIDIADSGTHVAFAAFVLIAGLVLTPVDLMGFAFGLRHAARRFQLRARKLAVASVICSITALALAPLAITVGTHVHGQLSSQHVSELPFGWVMTVLGIALAVSIVLGRLAGRLSREGMQAPYCERCGQSLTDDEPRLCPECRAAVSRLPWSRAECAAASASVQPQEPALTGTRLIRELERKTRESAQASEPEGER